MIKKMPPKCHIIKIGEMYNGRKNAPILRVHGDWLLKHFEVGDKLVIVPTKDGLLFTRSSPIEQKKND